MYPRPNPYQRHPLASSSRETENVGSGKIKMPKMPADRRNDWFNNKTVPQKFTTRPGPSDRREPEKPRLSKGFEDRRSRQLQTREHGADLRGLDYSKKTNPQIFTPPSQGRSNFFRQPMKPSEPITTKRFKPQSANYQVMPLNLARNAANQRPANLPKPLVQQPNMFGASVSKTLNSATFFRPPTKRLMVGKSTVNRSQVGQLANSATRKLRLAINMTAAPSPSNSERRNQPNHMDLLQVPVRSNGMNLKEYEIQKLHHLVQRKERMAMQKQITSEELQNFHSHYSPKLLKELRLRILHLNFGLQLVNREITRTKSRMWRLSRGMEVTA